MSRSSVADSPPNAVDAADAQLLTRVDLALGALARRELVTDEEARAILARLDVGGREPLPPYVEQARDRARAELGSGRLLAAARVMDALLDVRLAITEHGG